MRLVNDDAVIFGQQRVALRLGQQDTVGHQLDVGLRSGAVIETNSAADLAAPIDIQFFCDATGNGKCRDSARLGATNLCLNAQPRFKAHLGNLRRLARTRFTRDDDDLMCADGGDDVVFPRRDGQIRRIANERSLQPAFLSQCHRSAHLGQ